jgi:hypothetical protein
MSAHRLEFEQQGHRYTVDGRFVPSVTQVLEAAGLIDLEGIPTHILRRASERGTRVHQAAALLLRGELEWSSVDEAIGGYVRALDSFLRHSQFQPVKESVETPLYCAQYDFCGTPDVLGTYTIPRFHGDSVKVFAVLDWKTGMMSAVRYQLAAYAHALGVRHRATVKLNSDGTYNMAWFQPETQRHDLDTFLRALDDTRKAA